MDNIHQTISRINIILDSSDLTDSPSFRELHQSYKDICRDLSQKIYECSTLLQKRMKIEAVSLAKEYKISELIQVIDFPRKSEYLDIADLYDWEMPDTINLDVLTELQLAEAGLQDITPLLEQFRRIAKTNAVHDKLLLLREILRLDPDNPEWISSISLIENEYLTQRIKDAQKSIIAQKYEDLSDIYEELVTSKWHVMIPAIVLEKCQKIVIDYRMKEATQKGDSILNDINSAYSAYNVRELEDAIFRWNELRESEYFKPSNEALTQFEEANTFLTSKKEEEKRNLEFNQLLQQALDAINDQKALEYVERKYTKAKAYGLEIPSYIEKRVEQYRSDTLQRRRNATLLGYIKVASIAVVLVTIIILGVLFYIRETQEKRESMNLEMAIESGDLIKAHSILKGIEEKYPSIAQKSRIANLRSRLESLDEQQEANARLLSDYFSDIEKMIASDVLDVVAINTKLEASSKIAVEETDKLKHSELSKRAKKAIEAFELKGEESFLSSLRKLQQIKKDIAAYLEKNDLDNANKSLDEFKSLSDTARRIPGVSQTTIKNNQSILDSLSELEKNYNTTKQQMEVLSSIMDRLRKAKSIAEFSTQLNSLANNPKIKMNDDTQKMYNSLKNDVDIFNSINQYQASKNESILSHSSNFAYFSDAKQVLSYHDSLEKQKRELSTTLRALQQRAESNPYLVLYAKKGSTNIYIRFPKNQQIREASLSSSASDKQVSYYFRDERNRNVEVRMQHNGDIVDIIIGTNKHSVVTLILPQKITSKDSFPVDPYQKLISDLSEASGTVETNKLVEYYTSKILSAIKNKNLTPYWKMTYCKKILPCLIPLEPKGQSNFKDMDSELSKILNSESSSQSAEDSPTLNSKLTSYFNKLDTGALTREAKEIGLSSVFFDECMNFELMFLGTSIATKDHTSINHIALQRSRGDIICIDPSGKKFIVVGYINDGSCYINEQYKDMVKNHVLFTTKNDTTVNQFVSKWKQRFEEIHSDNIPWPAFWPSNPE